MIGETKKSEFILIWTGEIHNIKSVIDRLAMLAPKARMKETMALLVAELLEAYSNWGVSVVNGT